MKVHEIMTVHARSIAPDNTLVEAAGYMRSLDVGALPVCEGDDLAGIVTDRDLVVRGVADGKDPNTTTVQEVMSPGAVFVLADQDVEEVVRVMEARQIRRVPVLDREKRLVGIVSLGDVATSSNPAFSGMALRDVSQPAEPTSRQRRLAQLSGGDGLAEMPGAGEESPGSTGRVRSRTASARPARKQAGKRRTRTSAASSRKGTPRQSKRTSARGGTRRSAAAKGR